MGLVGFQTELRELMHIFGFARSNNVKYFYVGGSEIEERALNSVKGEKKLQDSRDQEQDVLYDRKNDLKCKLPRSIEF